MPAMASNCCSPCGRVRGCRPWRRSTPCERACRGRIVLRPMPLMPSFEDALLAALEEERRLSEERALLPGLLQHDLANVLCQVSLSASVLTTARSDAERTRAAQDLLGGV